MKRVLAPVAIVFSMAAASVDAGEIGHYNGGATNIRDLIMPDPGLYVPLYNYFYSTSRLNDANGNEIDSILIKPGPGSGLNANVDVHVHLYVLVPAVLWVSPWKILGAKYAALVTPVFANGSLEAALTRESGTGRGISSSHFDVGDLYVQPVWLGWSQPHWDIGLSYGFYAPVGHYETETVVLPIVGPVKTESAENIGYGFWTHQVQGTLAWYPWTHKGTAVVTALTWEINGNKKDFDLKPGQNLSLNWAISQFLPLNQDKTWLLEVGPAGYSTWQITDDTGRDAANPSVHDHVHTVGGQIGVTCVPWTASLNFRYTHDVSSVDRFKGNAFSVNLAKRF